MKKHWMLVASIVLFVMMVPTAEIDGLPQLFALIGMPLFFYWLVKTLPPVHQDHKQKEHAEAVGVSQKAEGLQSASSSRSAPSPREKEPQAAAQTQTTLQRKPEDPKAKSKELLTQIPEELRVLLPDSDMILLKKYSAQGTAQITYIANLNWVKKNDYGQSSQREVFLNSYHPFLQQFADDLHESVDELLQYLHYRPYLFQVSDSCLEVRLDSGYWHAAYKETVNGLSYDEWCQESQHDGGGSDSKVWTLYPSSKERPQDALLHESQYNQLPMPPCKGYWLEDGRCYMVDPWTLSGVFEFYIRTTYKAFYTDEAEAHELGRPGEQLKE